MTGFLIRRLGTSLIVVLGVVLLTFSMLHIIAPSPAIAVLGVKASPAAIKVWNQQNGFSDPFFVQFWHYIWHLLHGNLGYSYKLNQTVNALFAEKAPLSAFLSGSSLILAILIAIPLGIYQAVRRNRIGDITATVIAFVLYSMPVFLIALILIQVFALNLGWVDPNVSQDQSLTGALSDFKDLILHAEIRTPHDIEAEVGLTEGNIFQGELTFDQLLFNRPIPGYAQYRAPVRGMYMCGASTHPGGGVMGAPGANAAGAILRDLRLAQST